MGQIGDNFWLTSALSVESMIHWPMDYFGCADFRNCGSHDVNATFPAQIWKIQNGRYKIHFCTLFELKCLDLYEMK